MENMSQTDSDDYELFLRIRDKDTEALGSIYDKYHRLIYAIALDYLKDTTLAEDVVQQTFLDFWEESSHIMIRRSVSNYLYAMAKSLILRTIREKNKEVEIAYELSFIQGNEDRDIEEKIIAERNYRELCKAIDKLPPKVRDVCMMKMKGNMNNEAISERLGCSVKTVKNNYNNAIRFLRNYLKGRIVYFVLLLIMIGGIKG